MDIETRKRYAEKEGVEVAEYYLTKSRYLQQYGDGGPVLVEAAPERPVLVVLPTTTVRRIRDRETGEVVEETVPLKLDRHLRPASRGAPAKPKEPHQGKPVAKIAGAHEVGKLPEPAAAPAAPPAAGDADGKDKAKPKK
jgi:hypothetical protein